MKALEAFIKPFEAPKKCEKKTLIILIQLLEIQRVGRVHDQHPKYIEETCSVICKIHYLSTKTASLFARFSSISL